MPWNAPPSRPDKHGPSRYFSYIDVHNCIMGQLKRSEFVGVDAVEIDREGMEISIDGQVACKGCLVIDVHKDLICLGDPSEDNPLVQTIAYSYDVFIEGRGNIFRYDNFHPGFLYEGHRDEHHKHIFGWPPRPDDLGRVEWVGRERWPTLGEVVFEAMTWHASNYEALAEIGIDPESYARNPRSGPRIP